MQRQRKRAIVNTNPIQKSVTIVHYLWNVRKVATYLEDCVEEAEHLCHIYTI